MHRLFVYGTLAHENAQKEVLGRVCQLNRATFRGYRVRQGKWPYLVFQAGAVTRGWLMDGLSDDDLAKLDAYEETDIECPIYVRERADIDLDNQAVISAWIYFPVVENWRPDWLEGAGNG